VCVSWVVLNVGVLFSTSFHLVLSYTIDLQVVGACESGMCKQGTMGQGRLPAGGREIGDIYMTSCPTPAPVFTYAPSRTPTSAPTAPVTSAGWRVRHGCAIAPSKGSKSSVAWVTATAWPSPAVSTPPDSLCTMAVWLVEEGRAPHLLRPLAIGLPLRSKGKEKGGVDGHGVRGDVLCASGWCAAHVP
jgi:hypothetical protein